MLSPQINQAVGGFSGRRTAPFSFSQAFYLGFKLNGIADHSIPH